MTSDADSRSETFTIEEISAFDPEAVETAYGEIMHRHWLATIRECSGRTLNQVASERGVTKAAAQQTEVRDFTSLKIGTCIKQLRGCGYDIDERWIVRILGEGLLSAPRLPLDEAAK